MVMERIARPLKVLTIVSIVSASIMLVGIGYIISQVAHTNQVNNRILVQLSTSTNGSIMAGYEARKQNRCISWVTQNTLLQLLLLTPNLTKEQEATFRKIVPLPALSVKNFDGTVSALDCDTLLDQPVPGLPK